ncbi:DUF4142 domain-containing protein [Noviherbaspirillum massiliense]|uniref:DUF4142 domain-containing protein n=1 Tax=Noviherbaspirillum massiliense TaxID=1465823 RepID=UPI000365BDB9|nr:DUF4142 domain-containing protein [Noviherbaspirillum massiliense]
MTISFMAVLAGCGGQGDGGGADSFQGNATVAQTGNASSTPSSSSSSTAAQSSSFLASAFQDGAGEIALSRLALQKASDADVKAFAQRMIDDHTQANNEIRQLAQAKGITLPTTTSAEDQAALDRLSGLSGTIFDRTYMDHNVTVHDKDVTLFRQQALSATDADVRTLAGNILPALQVHLLAAKAINGKVAPSAFLTNAFQDGRAETLLGNLALQKSSNAAVRAFAQRMIEEHTAANSQIAQLAQAKDVSLPSATGAEHQSVLDDLSGMSGADFDTAYMNHNVIVHGVDVFQAITQANSGTDPEIKAFAATVLPVLERHLETAVTINAVLEPSLLFAAFQDGKGEILLSKLALQKATDAEVRQFAQRMIDDHTAANNQIMQLAQQKGIALPNEPSAENALAYVRLSQLSGAAFDRAYMSRNIDVHAQDVGLLRTASVSEQDAQIRAFATAQLPVIQAHLTTAQQIGNRLNAAAQQSQ